MKLTVDSSLKLIYSENELKGVVRAAKSVAEDMSALFGDCGGIINTDFLSETVNNGIIFGTVDSEILKSLEKAGVITLDCIRGKREVYKMCIVSEPMGNIRKALIIAGSDKRGAIYGLYKFSELCGVSPLRKWSGCEPSGKAGLELDFPDETVSKEPSVKYRGIFINDEWPAFGSWANNHFGGINAECYEGIFELILRLKGNYFWPAMWASSFNLDGPGLLSAELADEMGIVMSTSHHEPCMRAGAEYGLMRGKDSKYGDAWDFISNREGITKFWEDGLIRNAQYENVITLGMRGENDTAIMSNASLEDNIALLRDVLHTQNELIKKTVNENLSLVPRQIVLHNEVEKFYYGNGEYEGFYNDPELDGVCVVLGDNNCGYTRSLPTEKMRRHNGGYGMYYHIDMHGGPYAYEWVGNSLLERMWDQMSTAYDFGVREIWVVNVGDIATQELGISYFLDLAYDFDKYGSSNPNNTADYIKAWLNRQFSVLSDEDRAGLENVLAAYIRICERRKQEVMNDKVYHPVHFGETNELIANCDMIQSTCQKIKDSYPEEKLIGFWELIYYPCVGTANLMRTWCYAAKNRFYAEQNRNEANVLADKIKEGIEFDRRLTSEFHLIADKKFNGLGLSEHFGFVHWCEEGCKYPQRIYTEPANKPRIIVALANETGYTVGKQWSGNKLFSSCFIRPDADSLDIDIACGSREEIEYKITCDKPWLSFSRTEGRTSLTDRVKAYIDRAMLQGRDTARIIISGSQSRAEITVNAENRSFDGYDNMTFIEYDGYIAMEAEHYHSKKSEDGADFLCLKPYGRSGSAMRITPSYADFREKKDSPYLEYLFETKSAGSYELELSFAPSCPTTAKPTMPAAISINGGEKAFFESVRDPDAFYPTCAQCTEEAMNNVKRYRLTVECRQGINSLKYYHISPNLALERIVLWKQGSTVPQSYLGAKESFYIK